jgi:hypothetical protein
MEYFAGLDVSMEETYICVVDREGVVVHETKVASTPEGIAEALSKAPACRRVVFETGAHGAYALPWSERAHRARCLHREPSGTPGSPGPGYPQDRPQ